ncbi:MAG: hypothetical protein AB2L24_19655 [Mangrovibacterium sp.]
MKKKASWSIRSSWSPPDNGMPFPSAKANLYEYGTHVPLAVCWPGKITGNRGLGKN